MKKIRTWKTAKTINNIDFNLYLEPTLPATEEQLSCIDDFYANVLKIGLDIFVKKLANEGVISGILRNGEKVSIESN